MVSIVTLWLPILLSAVFVFAASSLIHMVFTYHNKDFRKTPNEEKVMDAFRGFALPPGEYVMPYAESSAIRKTPEFQEKMKKGPVVIMTVWGSSSPEMAKSLIQWFIYSGLIGVFAAYVAGRALEPGADYLSVFRFSGFTAFACYTVAHWQDSIWFKRSWGRSMRGTLDGIIYGAVTGATFGWLWPV